MSPMEQLPVELLVNVFTWFCTTNVVRKPKVQLPPRDPVDLRNVLTTTSVDWQRSLRVLMKVCKTWKDVVDYTPSLWACVCVRDPLEVVQQALAKSSQMPFIIIDTRTFEQPRFVPWLEDFLNAVGPHFHRCAAAYLSLPEHMITNLPFLEATIPHLVTLELVILKPEPEDVQPPVGRLRLFESHAPRLQNLRLQGLPAPFVLDSGIHAGLQTLTLGEINLSIRQLLDVLVQCGQLRKLHLSGMPRQEPLDTGKTADLNHLEELVCIVEEEVLIQFISHITAPLCHFFSTNLTRGEAFETTLRLHPFLSEALPNVLTGITRLRLHWNGKLNYLHFKALNKEGQVKLCYDMWSSDYDGISRAIRWLCGTFETAPLALHMVGSIFPLLRDEGPLRPLRKVTGLLLEDITKTEDTRLLVQILGQPDEELRLWRLPCLHTIVINGRMGPYDVSHIVETRYAFNRDPTSPARLRLLEFRGLPYSFLASCSIGSLKRTLGEEVVRWYGPTARNSSRVW